MRSPLELNNKIVFGQLKYKLNKHIHLSFFLEIDFMRTFNIIANRRIN